MLQVRERDLRKRREYVEELLHWHQRLDDEEIEIREMEKMLELNCRENVKKPQISNVERIRIENEKLDSTGSATKKTQKHIEKIEKSLQTLQNMPSNETSTDLEDDGGTVRILGKHLNRLWKRLTSEEIEKYAPTEQYVLNKYDLEKIYENAKLVVLERFNSKKRFPELLNSSSIDGEYQSNKEILGTDDTKQNVIVPELNLNFSPEPSVAAQVIAENSYYFSNTIDNTTEIQAESNTKHDEEAVIEINDKADNDDNCSDITEDSLNANDASAQSTINTVPLSAPLDAGYSAPLSMPLDAENSASLSAPVDAENSAQLIDDISFPNMEITSFFPESDGNTEQIADTSSKKQTHTLISSHDKYVSDDFESVRASDKTTITSDNNNTNISEDLVEDNSIATSPLPSPRSRSPSLSKELQQRLINIDDSLKDLREAFSRSPVLEVSSMEDDPTVNNTFTTNITSPTSSPSSSQLSSSAEAQNNAAEVVENVSTPTTSLKIRGKKIAENFNLSEVYPKYDIDADTSNTRDQQKVRPIGSEVSSITYITF